MILEDVPLVSTRSIKTDGDPLYLALKDVPKTIPNQVIIFKYLPLFNHYENLFQTNNTSRAVSDESVKAFLAKCKRLKYYNYDKCEDHMDNMACIMFLLCLIVPIGFFLAYYYYKNTQKTLLLNRCIRNDNLKKFIAEQNRLIFYNMHWVWRLGSEGAWLELIFCGETQQNLNQDINANLVKNTFYKNTWQGTSIKNVLERSKRNIGRGLAFGVSEKNLEILNLPNRSYYDKNKPENVEEEFYNSCDGSQRDNQISSMNIPNSIQGRSKLSMGRIDSDAKINKGCDILPQQPGVELNDYNYKISPIKVQIENGKNIGDNFDKKIVERSQDDLSSCSVEKKSPLSPRSPQMNKTIENNFNSLSTGKNKWDIGSASHDDEDDREYGIPSDSKVKLEVNGDNEENIAHNNTNNTDSIYIAQVEEIPD